MGFGEFFLQSNKGNNVDLNFRGKLRREKFEGDKKLLAIFDFFDKDGNGVIEENSLYSGNEIANLFSYFKQTAELNTDGENNVIDVDEAYSLTQFVDKLKTVSPKDIFTFLEKLAETKVTVTNSTETSVPDGTKMLVNIYSDGMRETVIYYPDGRVKFKIQETVITNEQYFQDAHALRNREVSMLKVNNKRGINQTRNVNIEAAPEAQAELREYLAANLKENSEYALKIPYDSGWITKVGIDLQDVKLGDSPIGIRGAGLDKLNDYIKEAQENLKLGETLLRGVNTPGSFSSIYKRETGVEELNYIKVELLRQTSSRYREAKILEQKIETLKTGIKEVKRLYQNAQTAKKGLPGTERLEVNYDAKLVEVITEFFGNSYVANAFVKAISEGIESKEELDNKFFEVIENIEQEALKELQNLLQGRTIKELEQRYQNQYRAVYGKDDVVPKIEELVNNGKAVGGFVQIGLMTAATIIAGAFTGGTGAVALDALVGYLETVGVDYALSLSEALTSQRGLTVEAHREILIKTGSTAKFVGFGMIAANPFAKIVGSAVGQGIDALAGKIARGAFSENAVPGALRVTTNGITKTTMSVSDMLKWTLVKGSEFTAELTAFTGFEIISEDKDFQEAFGEQGSMLSKMKVINSALQVFLGSFIKNKAVIKAQKTQLNDITKMLDDAGLKDAKITEHKSPINTIYTLEVDGKMMTFKSPEQLGKAAIALCALNYAKNMQVPEEIRAKSTTDLQKEYNILIKKDTLSEIEHTTLINLINELEVRGYNEFVNDMKGESKYVNNLDLQKSVLIGDKIFEIKPKDLENNFVKINEIKSEIEELRKTNSQKADELQIILDMMTNPTPMPEVTDKQIDAVVNYLMEHYAAKEDYLVEQMTGIHLDALGRFSYRLKGEFSTRDKIVNYVTSKSNQNKTLLDAYNDVRDKLGARTVFAKGNYASHSDVAELVKVGKYREAELRAAELQSEPALKILINAMQEAKENNKDLSAIRISNYTSENGIPIFTERQMEILKDQGVELGLDVSFIKLKRETDPNSSKMIVNGSSTKQQPSGYTALQVNFMTKSEEIVEWQYRGELVDEFAEAEHLPYDLRTGKQPWAQYPNLEPLFSPIADMLNEKNMPKEAYKQLNKYFTDYYTHLRRLELGFESKEPKLIDYSNYINERGVKTTFKFDKRLEASNLIKLHNVAELVKKGKLTKEQAQEKYANMINAKVLEGGNFDIDLVSEYKMDQDKVIEISDAEKVELLEFRDKIIKNISKMEYQYSVAQIRDYEWFPGIYERQRRNQIIQTFENLEFCKFYKTLCDKYNETDVYYNFIQKNIFNKAQNIDDIGAKYKLFESLKNNFDNLSENEKTNLLRYILEVNNDNYEFKKQVAEEFTNGKYDNDVLDYSTMRKVNEYNFSIIKQIHNDFSLHDINAAIAIKTEFEANLWQQFIDLIKKHSDKINKEDGRFPSFLVSNLKSDSDIQTAEICIKDGNAKYIYLITDNKSNKKIYSALRNISYIPKEDICKLMSFVHDDSGLKFIRKNAESVYSNKNCNPELKPTVLKFVYEYGINLNEIIDLINNKNFPNELIINIDKCIESENASKIMQYCKKSFSLGHTVDEMRSLVKNIKYVTPESFEVVSNIIKNKKYIIKEFNYRCRDTAPEVAKWAESYLNDNIFSLCKLPNITQDKLITYMYELSTVVKLANNKPQLFINGQYNQDVIDIFKKSRKKELSLEQYNLLSAQEQSCLNELEMQFAINIEYSYSKIFNAIAITDGDTVKKLLDKRFAKFTEKINQICSLGKEEQPILSDLIRNGRRKGKNGDAIPLSAPQKFDLINMSNVFKLLGDIDKYKTYVNKQVYILDIDKMRKDVFAEILKIMNVSEKEILDLKPENLNWDYRYVSHFLNDEVRNNSSLIDIVREASRGNFSSFINDPNNKYGQANAKTKKIFNNKGLNFQKWEEGPVQKEFTIGDSKFTIKLWNRSPQESLFDGSYTNCCTALNAINGASMSTYMLNKSINYVEIKDNTGQIIAFSRCYMGEVDGKPSLVMENIEMNNAIKKELSDQQINDFAENIFNYMKEYAANVGDKNTPVYMSTSYHHIGDAPFKKYDVEKKKVTFIGNISESRLYMNTYSDVVNTNSLKNKAAEFHVIKR